MRALVAAAPIATVLVLMVGLRWPAWRAGLVAAALAVAAALLGGGWRGAPGAPGAVDGLVGIAAEAGFVTLTVVAILGPALALHHLQGRTGATEVLREALGRLSPDPRVAALLVAWSFSLFLEGAAGFGTPVALAAPFLVAAGFGPVAAVTASLVGHAAGVSFGALGTPVAAQVAATEIPGADLARATAAYHGTLGWVLLGVVVVLVSRGVGTGQPPPWAWGLLAGVGFFGPYLAIAWLLGPELPTLGGALTSALVVAVAARVVRARSSPGSGSNPSGSSPVAVGPPAASAGVLADGRSAPVLRAATPYLALVVLVVATRGVPAVDDALAGVVVEWQLGDAFGGTVRPLQHPGLLLPLALLAGMAAQGAHLASLRAAARATNRQLAPVVVALLAMVLIARAMSQGGMTEDLALAAAGAGGAWPLLAPAVGALGTFVTGSATASNILFTDLQVSTADALDLPVRPLVGAQGFGAAVGNVICPHNIVAAAATVGLTGREGEVLRRTLPVAGTYLVLGGAMAWLLTA